jgi:dehydrogenase/reductase SDR family protein 7B
MKNSKFQNQVVWITGASSGIGEAMAKDFVKKGAKVILTARREDRLNTLANSLNSGRKEVCAKTLAADLSNLNSLPELAAQAILAFGHVDVLFNNAGVSQRGFVADTSFEIEHQMIKIDLLSPIALTKALLPHFIRRKSGRILVTSSLMGDLELPGNATYACVKHGINGYFYSLAYELEALGILVQVLQPGFVKTEVSLSSITSSGVAHGKMDSTHANAMSAEEFSAKVFPKIEAGRNSIFIAGKEGLAIYVRNWFPSIYRMAVRKFAKTYLKDRIPASETE